MPEISLTDFVDFVISSGTPKLSKVRQIKERGEYKPAFDFWKPIREGVVSFHRSRSQDRRDLDRILTPIDDPNKLGKYPDCIRGYRRFLGRKRITWFNPPSGRWGPRNLTIRVNPELGLNINGVPHIVKLYFKKDPLSRRRVDIIILLLHAALGRTARQGTHYAILDVPRGRLFEDDAPSTSLLPLLRGEAMSFVTMWESI